MGLPALLDNVEVTETGLTIPANMPFAEWMELGETLQRIDRAIQWWVGDWLNAGERNYGEKYAQALDETEAAYSTLRDYKWVSSSFELSLRRDNLSYSIHKEIAGIKNEKKRLNLLKQASEETALHKETDGKKGRKWTVRDIKKTARLINHNPKDPEPLPEGKYSVILADPPWQYEHMISESREIENQYPTMSLDEICDLPVLPLSADDCMLFLWTTSPHLKQALEVIEAWGFDYRTNMVWVKPSIGPGYYVRQRHEILLIARKGAPILPEPKVKPDSVLEAPRQKHSQKPEIVHKLIEKAYPNGTRIELFRRGDSPDGWAVWGNEAIDI